MAPMTRPGELQVTMVYNEPLCSPLEPWASIYGYRIDRADPVIWISDALLSEARRNVNVLARVDEREGEPDLLTIVGLDGRLGAAGDTWRTVIYCIGEYDVSRDCWRCYWPD